MDALVDGFAQDRLLLPVCEACGSAHLYPRPRCPHCGADRFTWREASGRGMVTSFSVVHRAPSPEFANSVPYTVGLVRLAEGPQMMAWIVDTPPEDVRAGLPVTLRFDTLPGGERRPVFAPTEGTP
jgi:uncharacterized OB-fold protein